MKGMMSMGDHLKWDTQCELQFIDRIGTGRYRTHAPDTNRVELLSGYLRDLHHRHEWGLLDRSTIYLHALWLNGDGPS